MALLIGASMFALLFIQLCVPCYVIVQVLLVRAYSGGWRKAALAPVTVAVPTALLSLLGFMQHSMLWPVPLLVFAPLGLGYLVMLVAARNRIHNPDLTNVSTL